MKQKYLKTALAWVLAALTALMPIACGSGSGNVKSSDIVYVTKAPRQTQDLNQGGDAAPEDTADTTLNETEPADTPTPKVTMTPMPTPTPPSTPVPGKRIADGEYYVLIYNDFTVDQSGCVWVVIGERSYQELPDGIISTVEIGDVITLRAYSFEVVDYEKTQENGVPMILFNDGTERCMYISETNTWRFIWPSGQPYTYEAERYLMPIAIDASLTDELTPRSEGQNVYGAPYSSSDPTVTVLDELQDFFRHHRGARSEYAEITVFGGEITNVVIRYYE
jgi:hypothetical protein